MARPRQKRKQRSSRSSVKTGIAGRTKAGRKKVNFLGNEIIAKNWDRKLTLAQNYDKLGLSVRLHNRTGGVEKKKNNIPKGGERENADYYIPEDSLRIQSGGAKLGQLIPSEVAVERDPETGAILRIVGEGSTENDDIKQRYGAAEPLNDLLNALEDDNMGDSSDDDDDDIDDQMDGVDKYNKNSSNVQRKRHMNQNANKDINSIVKQLEAQAALESEQIAHKKPRQQSSREKEWIQALVERYGDDYAAMFKDKKLNPRQQSEGDIKRRVRKWATKHNAG